MNVVGQDDRASLVQLAIKFSHTAANQIWVIILVVLCVDASPNNMVSKIPHNTKDIIVDGEIWWPHIGGHHTDSIHKGRFERRHLIDDLVIAKNRELGVAPSKQHIVSYEDTFKARVGNIGDLRVRC